MERKQESKKRDLQKTRKNKEKDADNPPIVPRIWHCTKKTYLRNEPIDKSRFS